MIAQKSFNRPLVNTREFLSLRANLPASFIDVTEIGFADVLLCLALGPVQLGPNVRSVGIDFISRQTIGCGFVHTADLNMSIAGIDIIDQASLFTAEQAL